MTVPAATTAVATVTATTIFGAMHGLETLTQLTDVRSNGAKTIRSAPVEISDAPRYPCAWVAKLGVVGSHPTHITHEP